MADFACAAPVPAIPTPEDVDEEDVRKQADEIAIFLKNTLVSAFKARENRDPTQEEVEALLEEVTEDRIKEMLGQMPEGSTSANNNDEEEEEEEEDDEDEDDDEEGMDSEDNNDGDAAAEDKENVNAATANIWGNFAATAAVPGSPMKQKTTDNAAAPAVTSPINK